MARAHAGPMLILFDLFGIACLLALVASPGVRDASHRLNLVDLPDEPRKTHGQPIPRVGGVAIAFSYAAALALVFVAPYQNLPFELPAAWDASWRLLPAAGVVFLTGLLDDVAGLKPIQKLLGQITAALLAYWAGFGVHVFQGQPLEDWVSLPLTVFWLVACSNALNLIDGMDGLAAGVAFFATATMLVAALIHEELAMAVVTAPLLGALLGFLRYNFNPASIFLGDSGSLLVGFLLGCYGALWTHKSATLLGMTAPLIALSLPLLDTTVAIIRRFLRKQPIFTADRGHIHHKLLDLGWTPRRAALTLYAIGGAAAALSLLYDVVQNDFGGLVIVIFCGAAWLGVQHLGYAEFGIASRLLIRGQLRGIIDAQIRLQAFERELDAISDIERLWKRIEEGCRDFGFAGARLQVNGRTWVTPAVAEASSRFWQVRVPLAADGYVNLYIDPSEKTHPIVLSHFTAIVEQAVNRIRRGGDSVRPVSTLQ